MVRPRLRQVGEAQREVSEGNGEVCAQGDVLRPLEDGHHQLQALLAHCARHQHESKGNSKDFESLM